MAKGKKEKATLTLEEKLKQALVPVEEQPYEIPENWCWTTMGMVADWGSGGTPSRKKPEYYNGTIPWVKTGELNDDYIYETGEKITEEAVAHSSAKLFPANTIAIAMYGATIGKVGILGVQATTNQACACAICSQALNYKYLFYYVRFQKNVFIGKAKGGAQPNISQETIKEHTIPLPPFAEQMRIVKRIESIFAKLDEAKEKAQAVVDGFEQRKSAILHKAFTGELTAQWRQEQGVSMDSWEHTTLKDCSSVIRDGLHGTPNYDEEGRYYFVNGNNFAGKEIEIKKDTKTVNEAEYKKYKVLLSEDITVFVSINGTLGKTAFYNGEPIILGKSACYVNVLSKLEKNFLRFFFESKEFIDYANEMATGSTIKNLSLKAIRSMPIYLPTINEQNIIVRILDDVTIKEQQAKKTAEAVIDQISIMKKTVLAHAFRGGLGTNELSEECAVELLKSVL